MKRLKELYFYRFGNLNSVKHKEHNMKEGYHVAPRVRGIYAFPRGYFEAFLVWSQYNEHWNKILLDDEGHKILYEDFYVNWSDDNIKEKYIKMLKKRHLKRQLISYKIDDNGTYMIYKMRPKKFTYSGPIWSHLVEYIKEEDVMERHGDWVKTSYKTYIKALHKCDTHDRFITYTFLQKKWDGNHGDPHNCPIVDNQEHYEVFIERL